MTPNARYLERCERGLKTLISFNASPRFSIYQQAFTPEHHVLLRKIVAQKAQIERLKEGTA